MPPGGIRTHNLRREAAADLPETAQPLGPAHVMLVTQINTKSNFMEVKTYKAMYSAWNPKDNYDMSASVFVVQFNGFMSLTS